MLGIPDLPVKIWRKIAARTASLTIASVCLSVVGSHAMLNGLSAGLGNVGLIASIAIPIGLASPLILMMTIKYFELEIAYERLAATAQLDSLTGSLNHGAFAEQVAGHLEQAGAEATGALLVVDADHFKSINDQFGHASGDKALTRIAGVIAGAVRPGTDLVGRLGGEEFGVFLPHTSPQQASAVAEAIRLSVEQVAFEVDGRKCPLSISIGGTTYWGPARFEELFRRADAKLYEAKHAGRNLVAMETPQRTVQPLRLIRTV
ncbi:GGDEF domain-containing protein [Pelagibacterium montanilacus]|uniref:GGDEF domain-containing protein n=1 Tax=Pelagibacterium montanilacus TaxID=2185280 RepID=UPI000F8C658D|nr:GGDEF domain-containing protein [Pelagibacterium montanilacus]